jgi:DNA-binding LacI/PurR family transcriptional regulator
VSNVLNDRGRVGPRTRQRVIAAIEDLDYHRNAGAISLRTRRSGRIAYPIPAGELGPTNLIMLEFLQALTSAAGRRDQHLVLATSDDGLSDIRGLIDSGAVDAVVLATVAAHDPRVALLAQRGIPFACFGRTDPDLPQSWVEVDNRGAVFDLTARLIGLGHARVAFLGYAAQGSWDVDRAGGYRDAMTNGGLSSVVSTPEPVGPHVERAIEALLDSTPALTAIVTGSDVLAAAVYAAAARRGIQIGADLAVTGFDGSLVGRLLTPPLTTLSIPTAEIAQRLIDRAMAEVDGPTGAPGELLMPDLIVGASG